MLGWVRVIGRVNKLVMHVVVDVCQDLVIITEVSNLVIIIIIMALLLNIIIINLVSNGGFLFIFCI